MPARSVICFRGVAYFGRVGSDSDGLAAFRPKLATSFGAILYRVNFDPSFLYAFLDYASDCSGEVSIEGSYFQIHGNSRFLVLSEVKRRLFVVDQGWSLALSSRSIFLF